MKKCMFQAHRGVSTEAPENTMSAFGCAVIQGYDYIEADPSVTADGKIVLLHDKTIARTARKFDGSALSPDISASELTYDELCRYDFGIGFSPKFVGEKIPLLSELLELSSKSGIKIKLDNKFERFSDTQKEAMYDDIGNSNAKVAFTCSELSTASELSKRFPNAEIHFDGAFDEDVFAQLSEQIPRDRLVFWMPVKCAQTSWVRVPFANEEICKKIKEKARLGIWIVSSAEQLNEALCLFGADIVETPGQVKPLIFEDALPDTHMHSEHSHDARDSIDKMARSAAEKGVSVICITDHCDVEFCKTLDLKKLAVESVDDARKTATVFDGKPKILAGIEMGESLWYPNDADEVLKLADYDTVIGSVHAARFDGYERPYAPFDFSEFERDRLEAFVDRYFDDMLELTEKCDFDVLAHLTCPFRYINGKYSLALDTHLYEEKIIEILKRTIARGAALEVNTSCLGSSYDMLMPEEWILKKYRELGGYLITVGSDAHICENVAHGFERMTAALKKLGFENIFYYEKRIARACKL